MHFKVRDKREEDDWQMVLRTKGVLAQYPEAVNSMGALVTYRDLLNDKTDSYSAKTVEFISLHDQKLAMTAQLKSEQKSIVESTMDLVNGARSWAIRKSQAELASALDFEKSDMAHLRNTNLFTKVEEVIALVSPYAEQMGDVNITAATITRLQAQTETNRNLMISRDATEDAAQAAHNACHAMLKSIKLMLADEVDPLVKKMENQFREFFDAHFSARVIRPTGRRHESQAPPDDEPTPDA